MGIMMFINSETAINNPSDNLDRTDNSLYNKIGGEDAIDKLVMMFYIKVSSDPTINKYFANIDMLAQIMHQKNYIGHILGGPVEYNGKSLREAHKHLTISSNDFDTTTRHLEQSMVELEFDKETVDEIMMLVAKTKAEVLNLECAFKV